MLIQTDITTFFLNIPNYKYDQKHIRMRVKYTFVKSIKSVNIISKEMKYFCIGIIIISCLTLVENIV